MSYGGGYGGGRGGGGYSNGYDRHERGGRDRNGYGDGQNGYVLSSNFGAQRPPPLQPLPSSFASSFSSLRMSWTSLELLY